LSVVTLSRWQKTLGSDTVVGRAKGSGRVRLSAIFLVSYGSWIRNDHTSFSCLRGHQSNLVSETLTRTPMASAMALPSTGMRALRCVRTLPISSRVSTILSVFRDGAISAGSRATTGAFIGVARRLRGPTSRDEDAAVPPTASSSSSSSPCFSSPPSAFLLLEAAAPTTPADRAMEQYLWLAAAVAVPAASVTIPAAAAAVAETFTQAAEGIIPRPAAAARMKASAESSLPYSWSEAMAASTTAAAAAAAVNASQ